MPNSANGYKTDLPKAIFLNDSFSVHYSQLGGGGVAAAFCRGRGGGRREGRGAFKRMFVILAARVTNFHTWKLEPRLKATSWMMVARK